MTFRGQVQGGTIVLANGVTLPEGAAVEITLVAPETIQDRTVRYELLRYAGIVEDLPSNASSTVDKVLYGGPDE